MRLEEREPGKGHAAQALSVHERGRARALLEALRESQVELREGWPAADRARAHPAPDACQQGRGPERLLSRHEPDTAKASEVAGEIEALASSSIARNRIRAATRDSPLSPAQPLSLPEMQATLLDGDTVLSNTRSPRKEATCGWSRTARSSPTGFLTRKRWRRRLAAPTSCSRLRGGDGPDRGGARGPPERARRDSPPTRCPRDRRQAHRHRPDGPLHFLPFTVLPDPGHADSTLVARHEVVGYRRPPSPRSCDGPTPLGARQPARWPSSPIPSSRLTTSGSPACARP